MATSNTRLSVYLEAELLAWAQAQAAAQGRTTSGWVRYVLLLLRKDMTQGGPLAATLEGGVHDQP